MWIYFIYLFYGLLWELLILAVQFLFWTCRLFSSQFTIYFTYVSAETHYIAQAAANKNI